MAVVNVGWIIPRINVLGGQKESIPPFCTNFVLLSHHPGLMHDSEIPFECVASPTSAHWSCRRESRRQVFILLMSVSILLGSGDGFFLEGMAAWGSLTIKHFVHEG